MEKKVLVVGADDAFFRRVYETLVLSGLQVAAYASHFPLGGGSPLSTLPRIDMSRLYHSEQIAGASQVNVDFPIDRAYLQLMLECERAFMATMDRLSAKPQSIGERKRLFRELLRFFTAFFENHPGITHVFFPRTPHFGWDLVLFFVARHLGVGTLILQRTDLNRLFIIRTDWRTELRLVENADGSNLPSNGVLALLDGDSDFTKYSKSLSTRIRTAGSERKPAVTLRGPESVIAWARLFRHLHSIRKNPWTDSAVFCNEPLSPVEKLALYRRKYALNKNCLKAYRALSVPPDLSVPFVYFAMHFQPERSTQPEGMEYEDQFLAIATLAAALPKGWLLYVKEHPRQFDSWPPDLRKMHARTPAHYEEISRLQGVRLLPAATDSNALISHARISCTVTGSTGWEALKRGKPAIVFGHSWYSACQSCAVVGSAGEAGAAITRLTAKDANEVSADVQAFLAALEPNLISSYGGAFLERPSEEDYEALVHSLASRLQAIIRGAERSL